MRLVLHQKNYILLLRIVGWVVGIVGWVERACSQDQLSFLKTISIYLPRLKTLTLPIYEKKEKSWIMFGLIFVAFTPAPTQLRRQTGGFQSEGLPHTPISRALTSNRCFAGIPLILSPYFLFAFIVHTFVLFVCVFVIHKTEIIHMYNLQFKIGGRLGMWRDVLSYRIQQYLKFFLLFICDRMIAFLLCPGESILF